MKTSDIFREALIYILNEKPKGAQKHLAEDLNLTKSLVNDYVRGRKNPSEERKEKIAEALGTSYMDMLILGLNLISQEKQFLYQSNNNEPKQLPDSIVPLLPKIERLDDKGFTALSAWLDGYLSKND